LLYPYLPSFSLCAVSRSQSYFHRKWVSKSQKVGFATRKKIKKREAIFFFTVSDRKWPLLGLASFPVYLAMVGEVGSLALQCEAAALSGALAAFLTRDPCVAGLGKSGS
jgi:hypothetical protein